MPDSDSARVMESERDQVVGALARAVFHLNGRLIEFGNQIVEDLELTTAWWQVLSALDQSRTPLPTAHLARNIGVARQSVQRIVDLLGERDLVRFARNPHHQRAKLVVLTQRGAEALRAADGRQKPVAARLVAKIGEQRLVDALAVLREVDAELAGGPD